MAMLLCAGCLILGRNTNKNKARFKCLCVHTLELLKHPAKHVDCNFSELFFLSLVVQGACATLSRFSIHVHLFDSLSVYLFSWRLSVGRQDIVVLGKNTD